MKQDALFFCEDPITLIPKTDHLNEANVEDVRFVPCGKCDFCLEKKAKEWAHRMYLEAKTTNKMAYVTLTFNDENNKDPNLDKRDIQLFMKRLRKNFGDRKIRYYAVGEYGEKNLRKHYHIVLFGVDGMDFFNRLQRLKLKEPIGRIDDDWMKIYRSWDKGFLKIERPIGGCYHYLAGYVTKISKRKDDIEARGLEPEFRLMSKGLGKKAVQFFINKVKQKKLRRPELPMHCFEYRYKGKDGKQKVAKRSLGRWLKRMLHDGIGMGSILDMWNKLNTEIIKADYLSKGVGMMNDAYFEVNHDIYSQIALKRGSP